jgi:cytochrome P450
MVFLLMELAINQDKQAKLYEEIQRVVGGSPNLTKEHLAQMSYLKACLRESHRYLHLSYMIHMTLPVVDV